MMKAMLLFAALFVQVPMAWAAQEVKLADGRSYLIDLPRGVQNPPVILVLHGGGGSGSHMVKVSGMTPAATKAGFAVIYPNGSGRTKFLTWNAGHCCAYASRSRVDDIGFMERVIDDAASRFGVDRRNAFVTGMSNGGMMSETLAAKRPDLIRAVASVAGPLDLPRTRPSGLPLMHIHGTADDVVPYAGGRGQRTVTKNVSFPPVEEVIAAAVKAQGMRLQSSQQVIDPVRRDGTRVVKTTYSAGGVPRVVFFKVEEGGHSWPGGPGRKGVSRDINATAEIVAFFRQHIR